MPGSAEPRTRRRPRCGAAFDARSDRPWPIGRPVTAQAPEVQAPRPALSADAVRPATTAGVLLWPAPVDWAEISPREQEIYELGFMTGYFLREDEVEQANADADRYYRAAFDRPTYRR